MDALLRYSSFKHPPTPSLNPLVVVEWMLDVCVDQRCHADVFLLAVNIMDRFLETLSLKKKQFQLLGAASIFLASKMTEPSPIPAITLVFGSSTAGGSSARVTGQVRRTVEP